MRYYFLTALLILVALVSTPVRAGDIDAAVEKATLSEDKSVAGAAVAELRAEGPAALKKLFELRDREAAKADGGEEQFKRLDALIDQVGGAKYCSVSRLYWHTDWETAQKAAAESGKPILSLRMMGNLTDELSCANSRFFRTSLYANAEISQYLRNNFVLHWKSVRPVPKVTIDFGDGRKLERTLTGNSIHYILASDGQVIDALPGLYGPAPFLERLQHAHAVASAYMQLEPDQRTAMLAGFHNQRVNDISRRWAQDLAKVGSSVAPASASPAEAVAKLKAALSAPASGQLAAAPPRAEAAAQVARPKADLEMPLIRAVVSIAALEKTTDDAVWEKIAALHAAEAKLDAASVALIRKQNPTAREAGKVSVTKSRVEDPILRIVANFQTSIALDTVRNEYLLHRKIHEWLAGGSADHDVEKLNDRVYAELFLTPKTDPWIGLLPQATYTAIENGGVVRQGDK